MSVDRTHAGTQSFRDTLAFTWRHWLRHPGLTAGVAGGTVAATVAACWCRSTPAGWFDAVEMFASERDAAR
jgi:hypothetical protein